MGMLSFMNPYGWITLPVLLLPFGKRLFHALPPVLFFLLGFLRAYSVLGIGEELRNGEGWYYVSIYDWGRGRVTHRYGKKGWVRVRSRDLTVLMGDRPAFPTDRVMVSGRVKGDTLTVYEARVRRGVKWWYDRVSALLLSRTLSEDQYRFALSVITGVRDLRWEVKRAFYETGTGHVLAISGLHVGIVFLALVLLLRLFVPGIYAPVIAAGAVWAYAWVVGFLPSVVRASLVLTLFALGSLLSRPVKPMNVLALSLLLSLLLKPLWIFSPSLWLSYSAVAGLFLLKGKVGKVFGASVFSLPFALHYFGKFAILYVPLNLLVLPLMTAFMYSQILSFVLPYPFTYSAALFYDLMEATVRWAHSLRLPPLRLSLGWPGVLLYLSALSFVLLCLRSRSNA